MLKYKRDNTWRCENHCWKKYNMTVFRVIEKGEFMLCKIFKFSILFYLSISKNDNCIYLLSGNLTTTALKKKIYSSLFRKGFWTSTLVHYYVKLLTELCVLEWHCCFGLVFRQHFKTFTNYWIVIDTMVLILYLFDYIASRNSLDNVVF